MLFLNLGKRGRVGLDFGLDVLLAHAARNQLIVLASKIEHQDGFMHAGTTFISE